MRPGLTRSAALGFLLATTLALPEPAGALPSAVPASGIPAAASGGSSAVGASAVSAAAANARIRSVLPARVRSKVLGKRFTMTVWDARSGAYVYRKRSTVALRGASTTKILTAVGALHSLGAAHRLPTTVRAGVTATELVLVAGGDPLLTSANLRALAASTRAALHKRGASLTASYTLHADDSLFTGDPISRGWSSSWVPRVVRPVGAFARDDREVRDATADVGRYFAAALRNVGVKATYRGEATAAAKAASIATYAGHTIGESVSRALLFSDNDTAEMLFRHIANANGQPATWAGARTAQRAVLKKLGVPLKKVTIIDGSGLSLQGRLTAKALTSALALALSSKHPELAPLRSYLPVAGRSGTLRASSQRFYSKPARCAAGLIQAKTGTLADAIALAGYAQGADGRTKVFVSIVNGRPTRYTRVQTRKAVDKVAASVTGCW